MSARERQTRCKKGVCQLLRGRPTAQPGAPLQPGIPGGAKAAAGLVRGLVFRAEARAQLSARFATRLRGSGRPLPLVGDRIEPEANDKIRRMTPVGVFFCWQGGAERDFVNSTKLTRCIRNNKPEVYKLNLLQQKCKYSLTDISLLFKIPITTNITSATVR